MRPFLPLFAALAVPATGAAAALPPAAAPAARATAPYAAAVATLADRLATSYVFPERGRAYAARLRAGLARGDYDGLADPDALSARLTADLDAVAHDGHLRVRPVAAPKPAAASAIPAAPIAAAKWLAPGVAYIAFTRFPDDAATTAAVAAFLRDHASARALIIDARQHHGGGIGEMQALVDQLYAAPTHLVTLELASAVVAREGAPFDESDRVRRVAAPAGLVRFEHWAVPAAGGAGLAQARVFYLTSRTTVSAAEHLALALKTTHRATLIGEPTHGAGHFGSWVPIGQGLRAFLPVGRTFDPATGRDWEDTGVQPDVAVPADRALDEALRLAGAPA